ncbi:CKLF-like MARVEL transmembrane domain-containing protein 7 [Parasteatoda tepidariorum]|uniref:CKLF-like MARVEL transmembrane domain-containing protein 7 n=1 Tax=Parasteatoda tepidariorum TaxID=114398 RepID=UPI0039BD919B
MNMLTPTGHIANDSNADHHHTPKMFFDLTYLRTPSGMLKILQAADGLFGYLCMRVVTKSYDFPAGRYYEFVALLGFVMALNLGFLHMIHVTDVTSKTIPWVLIELIYSLVWSFLCCIAGGIIASWAEYHTALAFSAINLLL